MAPLIEISALPSQAEIFALVPKVSCLLSLSCCPGKGFLPGGAEGYSTPTSTHPWPDGALLFLSLLPHPSSSNSTIKFYSCSFSLLFFCQEELWLDLCSAADPGCRAGSSMKVKHSQTPGTQRASPSSVLCVPCSSAGHFLRQQGISPLAAAEPGKCCCRKNDNLFFSFSTGHQLSKGCWCFLLWGAEKVTSD